MSLKFCWVVICFKGIVNGILFIAKYTPCFSFFITKILLTKGSMFVCLYYGCVKEMCFHFVSILNAKIEN